VWMPASEVYLSGIARVNLDALTFDILTSIHRFIVYTRYLITAQCRLQSAVLARPFLSVCPSVTFRYCIKTNEDTIVWFSASGRTILLVSEEVKFIRIFAGITPSEGVKVKRPPVASENLTYNQP